MSTSTRKGFPGSRWMRSAGEFFLESFESFSGSRGPGQQRLRLVLHEVVERAGYDAVVMYESSVEV